MGSIHVLFRSRRAGPFNAWTNAVTTDANGLSVNLLINHLSKDAIVRSWLPHEGRLEIIPSRDGAVGARVPSWLDERTLEITIDGTPANPSFLNSTRAEVANVSAGSKVVYRFPLCKNKTQEVVLGTEYTADWVGDTVMAISPVGSRAPLYRRNRQAGKTISVVEKTIPDIAFKL
jgi:hypothetical protein